MIDLTTLPVINIGLAIKIFELFVGGVFIFFSLLTLRQVSIMNKSVITPLGPEIQIVAYVQLVLSLIVFFLILLI